MKPSYSLLDLNYPLTLRPCSGSWANQCAIRLSMALQKAGLSFAGYGDPVCAHGHARGAESLANFLWKAIGPAFKYSQGAESRVANQKGIIFFKDISGFRGGQGDHIDLWNGYNTKSGEYFQESGEVWFWPLQ